MMVLPEMRKLGYRCSVYAPVRSLDTGRIPRAALRNMSAASTYAIVAATEALDDAGFTVEDIGETIDPTRTGVIVGNALGGANEIPRAEANRKAGKRLGRLGGTGIVKIMNSTASGNLAAYLGAKGRTCSLSAACASGLYNIGYGFELVARGVQDLCIAGAAEEDIWKYVGLSADNSAGMPTSYNDQPTEACRPYDRDRQGFVMSAGAGVLILEELGHACSRGAHIYAEIVGYGAANDGSDMFVTTGEGLRLSIEMAMRGARERGVNRIDYINTHGVGTQIGDRVEVAVLKPLFADQPLVSSTKSLSGHSQGAAGAHEAVFTVLMLENNFVAATRNLDNVAPECEGIRHVRTLYQGRVGTAMTFNSGLGGANACLILKKPSGV
jgi:3-oxoacyl-[acyl-carrier-protein] synthase-1